MANLEEIEVINNYVRVHYLYELIRHLHELRMNFLTFVYGKYVENTRRSEVQ